MSKTAKVTPIKPINDTGIEPVKPQDMTKGSETRLRNAARNSNVTLHEFSGWPTTDLLRVPNISWVCVRHLKEWFGWSVKKDAGVVCKMCPPTGANHWRAGEATYVIKGESLCTTHAKVKALYILEAQGRACLVG